MKLSTSYYLVLLLFIPGIFLGQKQNNIWYFGDKAGLDFNILQPVQIISDLKAIEGTASICDPEGQLLFYTNGVTVWDQQHNIMPNGSGLQGGESSTQAALIVPLPNSCNLYYLFATEDHNTDGGLTYSIVDMCLNNGLGDIISSRKNIQLQDRTAEKITAVLHANGTDIWILTHKLNSNEFLAYLLSASGLNTTPVVSAIGSFYGADAHIGPVKASHDGTKVVSSASFRDICEMFDFDRATGQLSNVFNLNSIFSQKQFVYGLEFSPNDSLLYMSTFYVINNLFQLNLRNLQLVTLNSTPGNYNYGMLQMGPDKKIYMARNESTFIDVIHQPNVPGPGCQYNEGGQILFPGTKSLSGLPNFAPYSFFLSEVKDWSLGNDTTLCEGDTLEIQLTSPSNCPVNYVWNDGSTSDHKSIYQTGIYWVEAQTSCQRFHDTIVVAQSPLLDLMLPDTFLCEGKKIIITAASPGASYKWSTGSTQSSILIDDPGTYWLQINNSCFSDADTFRVTRLNMPNSLLADTSFCAGDTVTVHLCHAQGSLLWSNGSKESSIQIEKGGTYWLELSNVCFTFRDEFEVTAILPPGIFINDTSICLGQSLSLDATQPMATYQWSDLSSGSSMTIDQAGEYGVTVTNECGKDSTSFLVETMDCDFSVFIPNVFTPNGDGINDFIKPYVSRVVEHFVFHVFDRWGNCVFMSNDNAANWNGMFNQQNCPAGVYAYSLDCMTVYGTSQRVKGDITLIR